MDRATIVCVLTVLFVPVSASKVDCFSGWLTGNIWKRGTDLTQGVSDWLWDPEYMRSRISVRLLKKSWKVEGVTFDEYVEEFPGGAEEAQNILNNNKLYDYIEMPLAEASLLFTMMNDDFNDKEFDSSMDSIIIIHPFLSSADEGYFSIPTVTALGMRNIHRRYNVFLFHMPQLNLNIFFNIVREAIGVATRYEAMAEVLCSFIIEAVDQHWQPSNIHFVGYSYSANLAGYMARWVKYNTKRKINSIMCLDPYSIQYNENVFHVNRNDAEVVHCLHTSSYVEGTRERIATADFVFNDGFIQPECAIEMKNYLDNILNLKLFIPEPSLCSHLQVVTRFWYVILFPSKFKCRQCETWPLFQNCVCDEKPLSVISYPIENRDAQGIYYLRTSSSWPYGQGDDGVVCTLEKEKV